MHNGVAVFFRFASRRSPNCKEVICRLFSLPESELVLVPPGKESSPTSKQKESFSASISLFSLAPVDFSTTGVGGGVKGESWRRCATVTATLSFHFTTLNLRAVSAACGVFGMYKFLITHFSPSALILIGVFECVYNVYNSNLN